MKKKFYLLLLLCITLVSSCEQMNFDTSEDSTSQKTTDDVVIISPEGKESQSAIQQRIEKNPELYIFSNPYSEFWKEDSNLRSAPLVEYGYDIKEYVASYVSRLPEGYLYDDRLVAGRDYIVKAYFYKKMIYVPKGMTILIPPSSLMDSFYPMGYLPGTNQAGYTLSPLIFCDGTYDAYCLITEVREITHDASGQQVAELDNPVYFPYHAENPSNYAFKYQYIDSAEFEW